MDKTNLVRRVKEKRVARHMRKEEKLVHRRCPRQKQVETMLQKSGRPGRTGNKTCYQGKTEKKF